MDVAAAESLVAAVKDKDISLAGIKPNQTTANFAGWELKPPDAVLLASDLSKAGVTGSVTSVNVLSNSLDVESADLLLKVKAEKSHLRTLCGLTHTETELDLSHSLLGPGDAKLLAHEISVIGSITEVD